PWIATQGSTREMYGLPRAICSTVRSSLPAPASARARPAPSEGAPEDGVPQSAYELLLKSLFEDSFDKKERLLRHALSAAPSYLRAKIALAGLYRDNDQDEKAAAALSPIATRD